MVKCQVGAEPSLFASVPRSLLFSVFQFIGDGTDWSHLQRVTRHWQLCARDASSWYSLSFHQPPTTANLNSVRSLRRLVSFSFPVAAAPGHAYAQRARDPYLDSAVAAWVAQLPLLVHLQCRMHASDFGMHSPHLKLRSLVLREPMFTNDSFIFRGVFCAALSRLRGLESLTYWSAEDALQQGLCNLCKGVEASELRAIAALGAHGLQTLSLPIVGTNQCFDILRGLKELRNLDYGAVWQDSLSTEGLAFFPGLTRLRIRDPEVVHEGVPDLRPLVALKHLRWLRIHLRLDGDRSQWLPTLGDLIQITHLELDCYWYDEPDRFLDLVLVLRRMSSLTSLVVRRPAETESDAVGRAVDLHELTSVDLSTCSASEAHRLLASEHEV